MIRVAITAEAFAAIEATMPLGSVGYERQTDASGEHHIWLEPHVLAKLKHLRGPGETFSDVILRLAAGGA
jgi:hypothetical protein